jgi:hypothetical protein
MKTIYEGELKKQLIPIGEDLDRFMHSEFSIDTTESADNIKKILDIAKSEFPKPILDADAWADYGERIDKWHNKWFGDTE